MHAWPAVPIQQQVIVGQRTEPKEMAAKNQLTQTLKLTNDYWKERPQLIRQEISNTDWKPSIHSYLNKLLRIVGQDQAEPSEYSDDSGNISDEMDEIPQETVNRQLTTQKTKMSEFEGDVAFIFHEADHPYTETRRARTSKEHF